MHLLRASVGRTRSLRFVSAAIVIGGCGHAVAPAPPDCDRSVTVGRQTDIAAIESCTRIGGLTIRTGASVTLAKLAKLEAIAGDLRIGPTLAVDELSLPRLRTIGGALHVSANGSLRGVFLPALEHAGRVEVTGNVELATLSLPRLVDTGALSVTDCGELEIIDMSALATVTGEVVVAGTPKLHVIEAPQLADRLAAAQSPR